MHNLPTENAHRLFVPRIAYLIGTVSENGSENIIPVSSVTSVSKNPQRIVVAVYKQWQTYQNLLKAEGFTLTIPTISQQEGIWKLGAKYSGYEVPEGKDKLEMSGLVIEHVNGWYAPVVGGKSVGYMNCKLVSAADIESDHGIFYGEILEARFNERYMDSEGLYHTNPKPFMQAVKNQFATSTDFWTLPYYDEPKTHRENERK